MIPFRSLHYLFFALFGWLVFLGVVLTGCSSNKTIDLNLNKSFEARSDKPDKGISFENELTSWHFWLVNLQIQNSELSGFCSGLWLHPRLVITAAHCLAEQNLTIRMTVTLNIFKQPTVTVQSNQYFIPQSYKKARNLVSETRADIGVVILPVDTLPAGIQEQRSLIPFSLIWAVEAYQAMHRQQPNKISMNEILKNPLDPTRWLTIIKDSYLSFRNWKIFHPNEIWAAGYGAQHFDPTYDISWTSGYLNVVQIERVRYLPPLNVWAQFGPTSGTVLPGDSGGPLFFFWKQKWHFAGIVSGGFFFKPIPRKGPSDPVAMFFTGVIDHLPWLKNIARMHNVTLEKSFPELDAIE